MMTTEKRIIMTDSLTKSRRALYRWAGWFFLINIFLALLIGISYVRVLPDFHLMAGITRGGVALAWIFLIVSFITQLTIVFFFCCLMVIAIISIIPRRWLAFTLAIIFAAALIFALIVDIATFDLYHMHYFSEGLRIIWAGATSQVIALSSTELFLLIAVTVVLLIIEFFIALFVWRRIVKQKKGYRGYIFASGLILVFLMSYSSMFVATAMTYRHWFSPVDNHIVLEDARVLPYFNDIYGWLVPGDPSIRHILTSKGEIYFQVRKLNHPLRYPIHPLQCKIPKKLPNVLIIGIDTWRYDSMNESVTPHIYRFAQRTLQFKDHWSGGNCTQPGLISLFYGLPDNYWTAFLNQRRGPLLIHQFLKNNYEMGIFISAPLNYPPFDKTIFREVKHLVMQTPGGNSIVRDRAITNEFNRFLKTRNKEQPFFSFLFYDAVHNYCEQATPKYKPFQPAVNQCDRFSLTPSTDPKPYVNRYHNAAYFVDGEVQKVLDALKAHHLLENTIVIITADHGEQLNDERMGYWVHASAYTPYQLHVPLLVYWPGKTPQVNSYFTTHYDIVPTLMTEIFGCQNSLADYTLGRSLFSNKPRPYLIAGSYGDYAVVTKTQVTRIYPDGDYVINYLNGHPKYGAQLDRNSLQQVLEDLKKYFQY
ncbi:DUF3413 domain-containing protein [Coxiella burnetii]|uniref:DUF3413 domain-containing protein n=1 Tax=Coxiella burnetii TaxID=777 RepID=UPI002230625F|nr:DUF3413 domain-containing protein [Coxiella burnetii]